MIYFLSFNEFIVLTKKVHNGTRDADYNLFISIIVVWF